VKITRLYLRNYRVYEDEVDLELPGGLVGVYGLNGAGKSYLVESILWTIWGRSRTDKSEVRTTGVNGDCITEVEFEHEGHLYLVRRTVSGINHTVRAEAMANGQQVAASVTDVRRYLHTILGMDDAAFRASVFAEQKQIAAFSGRTPAQRRDLVLRLLGITPLDTARDLARTDARVARESVERARSVLPDLDELREAAAAIASVAEEAAATAAAAAQRKAAAAAEALTASTQVRALEQQREAHERLLEEGKRVRADIDALDERLGRLDDELVRLRADAAEMSGLHADTERLAEARRLHALVETCERAEAERVALPPLTEVVPPDEEAVRTARATAEEARAAKAAAADARSRLQADADRAVAQLARAEGLSGDEACELCGQPLGQAFDQVIAHRRDEAATIQAQAAEAAIRLTTASADADAATGAVATLEKALVATRAAWEAAAAVRARHDAATARVAEAIAALGRPPASGEAAALAAEIAALQAAADRVAHLAGVLTRLPEAQAARAAEAARREEAAARRTELLAQVHELGYDEAALATAAASLAARDLEAAAAATEAEAAMRAKDAAGAHAEAALKALAMGEEQHAALTAHGEDARHLGRAAELLNAFRTNVVADVGPRLQGFASSLFAELTDNEYDELTIEADTYGIKIRDAGVLHGLDRFSGSEIDLANLALRVAISEQVRFQSGGAVGLLVLDEVFGPLDDDRKDRMLLALERLRARFRQILVITHDDAIKAQLPTAIEVVKVGPRRATAKVISNS
jgi:DNA repair exonuclease SbcCD ATPase subunit